MLGVQAVLIFLTTDCKNAIHLVLVNEKGIKEIGSMYKKSIIVNIVDLGFWGLTHIILPLLKAKIDQEAFLYEPIDNNTNFIYYILCNVLGP